MEKTIYTDPKTFKQSEKFYYVNFVDSDGDYDSNYSIKIDDKSHAINRAKWHLRNKFSLNRIPYYVTSIVVYDSKKGFVCEFTCD